MSSIEYIKFSIEDSSFLEDCKKVFTYLKDSKGNKLENSREISELISQNICVLGYFKNPEQHESWSLNNLVSFIIKDLHVDLLELNQEGESNGILTFDSKSYPYGGTDCLIIFLKSFKFDSYEVYDGIEKFKVDWVNKYSYKLSPASNIETRTSFFRKMVNLLVGKSC